MTFIFSVTILYVLLIVEMISIKVAALKFGNSYSSRILQRHVSKHNLHLQVTSDTISKYSVQANNIIGDIEMERLGSMFADKLQPGSVILLKGEE